MLISRHPSSISQYTWWESPSPRSKK